MSAGFDVVVVPDFAGPARLTFEARTLYFLASWLAHVPDRTRFPLHLACIGPPPWRVAELAARAGAIVSVHEPAPARHGVYANKLRGFEAPRRTERMLLLDADIVIFGDLAPLATAIPADAIAAAPSHGRIILPEMWEELYARLELTLPARTMANFHATLADDGPGSLYPSVNSGVVHVPRGSPLRDVWLAHLEVLGERRPAWTPLLKPLDLLVGDEPALATALSVLRARGARFASLPNEYNVRWRHLYRRSPTLAQTVLFHMMGGFAEGDTLRAKLVPDSLVYERKMAKRYLRRWLRDSEHRGAELARDVAPALWELRALRARLRGLYDVYLRDLV